MGKAKRYRFIHKQRFMGKTLKDSFIKTIRNEQELQQTIDVLYSDPHVFSVDYEEIKY